MGHLTVGGHTLQRPEPALGPLRVLIVSFGQDTGGQGIRIARAFARHAPDWEVRSYCVSQTYIAYDRDLTIERDAIELFSRSDVVHCNNTLAGMNGLQLRSLRGVSAFKGQKRRGTLLHHHGTRFRSDPESLLKQAKSYNALQVVSTVDLLTIAPDELEWLPAPYELDELEALVPKRRRDDKVRVVHAPTHRGVKSTELFLEAMANIERRHPNVETVLIEGQPHARCLQLKAGGDVFYDQLSLGYGNNAIEAWGMRLPVVCGVADPLVRQTMLDTFGSLPFVEATPETLEQRLEELVVDAKLRKLWASIGRTHAERFHAAHVVVAQLARLYERARLMAT